MKHAALTYLLSLLVLVFVTGCAGTRYPVRDYPYPLPRDDRDWEKRDKDWEERDRDWEERERDRDRDWEDRGRDSRRENGRSYPFSALDIPRGHLPPPGECKVWFPGKPPGHQPPPQSCSSALRNAPLGAWVISHEGSRYRVSIFNRNRRNIIDEVRYYLAN
ncbi:hypothetical protein CLV24_1383 [Pontibacter ummariensis]|uniref:Uncharacterized protein n=2 Tax=Pontibacter ummariensis TaxID=1610492 RepID=A0A239LAC2_9BACT|nr:hypothetical protein CLV24_1383 [Pontibacter ummariensis]SNT27576.1 hypothetical protein SAMN06296052_13830 [Pontibacter ummariensis]